MISLSPKKSKDYQPQVFTLDHSLLALTKLSSLITAAWDLIKQSYGRKSVRKKHVIQDMKKVVSLLTNTQCSVTMVYSQF